MERTSPLLFPFLELLYNQTVLWCRVARSFLVYMGSEVVVLSGVSGLKLHELLHECYSVRIKLRWR